MADRMGTEVTPIRRKGGLTLVQWRRGSKLHRNWVPDGDVVQDGELFVVDKPSAGIPYGQNFAKLLTPSVTPDAIDAELKRRGIWTIQDLRANPNSALGALQAAYGIDLAQLFQAAAAFEAKEKEAAVKQDD